MFFIIKIVAFTVLQELGNKPLKIFISGYSDYFLGRNLKYFDDRPFEQNNLSDSGFISDCKINQDGEFFTINIGGKYLCETNKNILPCKDQPADFWTITPVSFGYNFLRQDLCLTFNNRALKLSTCDNRIEQVFDFLEIPEILMREKFILKLKIEDIRQIIERGEKYEEVLKEKMFPKTFKEFVDKNFNEKDSENAKKILEGLWNLGNPFGRLNWKSRSLLKYLCPII